MNKQVSLQQPIISISFKNNLIRIHKITLDLLGQPDYIQLLVNPDDRTIAIMKGVCSDKLAHRVHYERIKKGQSFELYSLHLLRSLMSISRQCEFMKAYRIYGIFLPDYKIAKFHIDKCVLVGTERGTNEE